MGAGQRTLFETYGGNLDRLRQDLGQAEAQLQGELARAVPLHFPTKVAFLDGLVDQVLFFQRGLVQARARGFEGQAALEWAEYLSWPECWRRARRGWRRDLLMRYAFEEPSCGWQRVLHARHRDDPAGIGPPRNELNWYPTELQFGPYPALRNERRAEKKLHVAALEAHITFDPWTTPDPLSPVRRLDPFLTWTLELNAVRKYGKTINVGRVIIDQPRDYVVDTIVRRLTALAAEREAQPQNRERDLPPHVAESFQNLVTYLRQTVSEFQTAKTARQRAAALDRHVRIPLEVATIPVDVIPEDMPPGWLGIFLGFAFERRGLLSIREAVRLWDSARLLVEHWQQSRFPRRPVEGAAARRIVDRLASMQRLLQGKSLLAYLAKASREVWSSPEIPSGHDVGTTPPEQEKFLDDDRRSGE